MALNQADYKKPLDATNKKTLLLNYVPTRSRRQHASTPARLFEINWETVLARLTYKSRKH